MFKFFDIIITFLTTIVNFVVNMILTIFYVIQFILKGVTYAFSCISYMPPFLMAFVMAVIGFSVVMVLINRS